LLHARFVRQIALSVKLEYTQGAEWFNVGRYGGRDLAGSPVVALDLRRAAMNGLVAGPLATLWDGRDSFGRYRAEDGGPGWDCKLSEWFVEDEIVGMVHALLDGELSPLEIAPLTAPSHFTGHRVRGVDFFADLSVVHADDGEAIANAGSQLVGKPLNHQPLPSWHFLRAAVLVFEDNEQLAIEFE